jgi:NAD-dependent SIR2 family protein deacetylase
MRLTIVKDDNLVQVDGEGHTVDCSALPEDFHALQWDGAAGEVEYKPTRCDHCGARSKKANEFIRDVELYQPYVNAWQLAKAEHDRKAAEALFAAQQPAEGSQDAARPEG